MRADPEALADRLEDLAAMRPRVLAGIAGAPGAGKSTLAETVGAALSARGVPVAIVPMDGFHLADVALDALGRRGAKGAVDTFDGAGYAALLARIAAGGETVWAPAFDRELEQPIAGSIAVPAATGIVITEGNYLLLPHQPWARIRPLLDAAWYLDIDPAVRYSRLVERHVRFGKSRPAAEAWVHDVDEPNAATIAPTAALADLLLLAE
ncbi:nucleoside/nucleotide kinase family protein [Amnibacterium sp.]|uniref:nucleoside/nucleotide kinase family protein n=1 Tax=Amnibacterium sp. TaxID=1872496 RepID=UPI00261FB9BA|nr:nucleoside/nucleotide kinase family protein [Amnibacterium sp.]MCU1473126.1 nucleoside/nucleotide kinase family protein [Amnibacterium sp.]